MFCFVSIKGEIDEKQKKSIAELKKEKEEEDDGTVLLGVRVMVFNVTFNNFSYILAVSFVGGGPGENH